MNRPFGVTIYAKPAGRMQRWFGRSTKARAVPTRGYTPPARPRRVPLVRFRYTLWLFVLGGGYVASQVWGTPHLLTTYEYWGSHDNPSSSTCNYWGLHSQTVDVDGACPFFKLLKAQEADRG